MLQNILDLFRTPPTKIAKRELALAYRRTLEAQATKEYAQSVIDMNDVRITRLEAFIAEQCAWPSTRKGGHQSPPERTSTQRPRTQGSTKATLVRSA